MEELHKGGKQPVARSHHYVPEFYLAGFTPTGRRDDFLWVHDRKAGKVWTCRPRNVAAERDFYRVELPDVAVDIVEKALAEFETQASATFSKIRQTRQFPRVGEDYDNLLNFIALQATRVPQFRAMFERNKAHFAKARVRALAANPHAFKQFAEELRQEGHNLPEGMTREGLLEFLEDEGRYTIRIPQEASIQNMTEMAEHLLPVLSARHWSLLVAKEGEDDFVCSDRPVTVIPLGPNLPAFFGFGPGTEVLMPLDRTIAIVGRFDHPGQVLEIDRNMVGYFNRQMVDYSERFVFSARESFRVSVLKGRDSEP